MRFLYLKQNTFGMSLNACLKGEKVWLLIWKKKLFSAKAADVQPSSVRGS